MAQNEPKFESIRIKAPVPVTDNEESTWGVLKVGGARPIPPQNHVPVLAVSRSNRPGTTRHPPHPGQRVHAVPIHPPDSLPVNIYLGSSLEQATPSTWRRFPSSAEASALRASRRDILISPNLTSEPGRRRGPPTSTAGQLQLSWKQLISPGQAQKCDVSLYGIKVAG